MSLSWSSVKALSIPVAGVSRDVKRVTAGGVTLWEKPNPLPYDAEVEYLESTGTQTLNTRLNSIAWTTLDIDIAATGQYSSNGNFFGSYYDSNSGMFASVGYTSIGGGRMEFTTRANEKNYAIGWMILYASSSQWYLKHTLHIDWNNPSVGTSSITGTFDGAQPKTYITTKQFTDNTTKLKLFCRSQGTAGNDSEKTKCRIFRATIWQNGIKVRDYIPVRVGTVGYLYDKANPTGGPLGNGLYPNSGSGAFVVGPDANA